MKFLHAIAVLTVVGATSSAAFAAPPSYPLLCRGGPGMRIMTNHDVDASGIPGATAMSIYFTPSSQAGSVREPGPGGAVRGPRQLTADAGHDLVPRHGLDEVVVGADEESRHAVGRLDAVGGDEDDGDAVAMLLPEPAADLVAAEAGEPDLEDREVDSVLERPGERLVARRRLDDVESRGSEGPPQLAASLIVAVCDDDRSAIALSPQRRLHFSPRASFAPPTPDALGRQA